MTRGRPAVPRATDLDPLVETIEPGRSLVRIHPRARGPLAFNGTTAHGRFRPSFDRAGCVIPTAYAALDVETALSETLLRAVSRLGRGSVRTRLYRFELDGLDLAVLRVHRPLRVVRLHGTGLVRLRVLREHLVDTPDSEYAYTARWAKALHGTRTRPHGLCWTSRQNDSSRALLLWEPRLPDRAIDLDGPVIALDAEPGLELVRTVCADAGVDFEG